MRTEAGVTDPRVKISDVKEIVQGSPATIDGFYPETLTVTPTVTRAGSGGGYTVRLDWSWTPPKADGLTDWYAQWELKVSGGSDENSQSVLFGGPSVFNWKDKPGWFSPEPLKKNLYVFELSAYIIALVNGQPGHGGVVTLKRITIDLRDLGF